MRLECIVEPEQEPVTLEEVKAYLRIDDDSEDVLLQALIKAAREYCENYQRVAYFPRTMRLTLAPGEWGSSLELPRTKYGCTVEKVYSVDLQGIQKDVEGSFQFAIVGNINTNLVVVDDTPYSNTLAIEYIAGSEEQPPEAVKTAIKLLVSGWYENRLPASDKANNVVPYGVFALLTPGRVPA
ncbi:MAG: head-tail connector protein [Phascolarctobacterium sp.]